MVDQALLVAPHIATPPETLGLTGGEPTLLGARLRAVIDAFRFVAPSARIDVLTNGRLLAKHELATQLLDGIAAPVQWNVPLYGHASLLHDFVVQNYGAFDETIAGLLNLHEYEQSIELRIVLIEPVLEHLCELAEFITMNLPFVSHVALMGCEPIGFALANPSLCKVDLRHWWSTLERSTLLMEQRGMRVVLMNTPHCLLPASLWRLAAQSISEWKNDYLEECSLCIEKAHCCGLFVSHKRGWLPGKIIPITNSVGIEDQNVTN
jgi:His-Xaa-Ser system radical SAM maturase HxsC